MLKIGVSPRPEGYQELPGIPGWLSRLLYARDVRGEEEAEKFLHPDMNQLLPPERLHDMDRATSLLTKARNEKKRTVIYGDYDVDGVSASAILKEAFHRFGMPSDVYIPDRHKEGYGLNEEAVRALSEKYDVLVTVDCGITAIRETALAKERGMTVIITDHHRHLEQLPPADAVITPLLGEYPFPFLCGAGVAWKLATALLRDGALDLMELAALATVADMVSLTGENRVIVALGLEKLSATSRPGLRAIMNRAGIYDRVSSEQVAFQLAPRMNACGRMESAGIALELLLTRDLARAEELALKMESLNQERKHQETLVLDEAQRQVNQMDLVDTLAVVVQGDNWNSGVVGLAAGRIAEKYWYPTVALARQGDICVGSARSAGDIDIHAALSQCADLFDRFGGHRQAAGLSIRADRVAEFTRRLSQAVGEQTGGMPPEPTILCDGEMTLAEVTEETVGWLNRLEPFGIGNPAPRFLCRDAEPLSLVKVGAQGAHLKCTFQQGKEIRGGIFFGAGALADALEGRCQVVMTPAINEFRGRVTAECRLYALQTQPETLEKNGEREILSYLSEFLGKEKARPIFDQELDNLMAGRQGTALLCRCLETAKRMREKYPQADFALDSADDARAYHTVLLYGHGGKISPAYRHIVLCDGDLGEAAACAAACPRAQVYALPVTQAARRMLRDMFVPVEKMRQCYMRLKNGAPRDLNAFAQSVGLSRAQGAFALRVLSDIELINARLSPFEVELLPMRRRGPEESRLYRRAKEE